jgi:hypothetical protein
MRVDLFYRDVLIGFGHGPSGVGDVVDVGGPQ